MLCALSPVGVEYLGRKEVRSENWLLVAWMAHGLAWLQTCIQRPPIFEFVFKKFGNLYLKMGWHGSKLAFNVTKFGSCFIESRTVEYVFFYFFYDFISILQVYCLMRPVRQDLNVIFFNI